MTDKELLTQYMQENGYIRFEETHVDGFYYMIKKVDNPHFKDGGIPCVVTIQNSKIRVLTFEEKIAIIYA